MLSSDFETLSYHSVCFFCAQLSINFLLCITKKGCKNSLFFSVFSFFLKIIILRLLKHYKIWVSSICVFLFWLLKGKKKANKNDNWNFLIWFFGPRMAVSWPICFSENALLKPLFYSVLGVCAFWPSCQKGEIFDPPK